MNYSLDIINILDNEIIPSWEKNLKPLGVILPGAKTWQRKREIKQSLGHIIYAWMNKGTKIKGIDSINWIRTNLFLDDVRDDQTLRHMSTQGGLNGRSRNGIMPNGEICKRGEYALIDLETTYPGWTPKARLNKLHTTNWDSVKEVYKFKCATCGALEGKPHPKDSVILTKLEKGHMDPSKPLEVGNIIPQCTLCNKPYKNDYVFDANGFVTAIHNPNIINKSSNDVQKAIYEILKKKFEL